METRYIPGNDLDFVAFIKSKGNAAQITEMDGHFRWIVTEDDVTYIVRPEATKPNDEQSN